MIRKCIPCFGTGEFRLEVPDDYDVLVMCDECRGTGIARNSVIDDEREKAKAGRKE